MPDVLEEVLNTANAIAPIWNNDVWGSLQARRFDEAETNLQGLLAKMSALEWTGVYWMGMVKGIPAFRGELDTSSWKNEVLPRIGEAIILAASPLKISAAYSSVGNDELATFHNFLLASIPETAPDKKLGWIKIHQPSILNFFLANPLGLHLTASLDFLADKSLVRLKTLPENLKTALFSAQTAEIIKKVSEQNNVPEGKVSSVAGAIGLILLGFIHPEELPQEISERTGLAQPVGKAISDSLNNRIFAPLRETLDGIYAPLPHEEPGAAPKLIEEIRKPFGQVQGKPEAATEKPIEIKIGEIFGGGPLTMPTVPGSGETSAPPPAPFPPPPVKIFPAGVFGSSPPTTSGAKISEPPSAGPTEPAPTMIHEETVTKPLRAASGFSIGVPTSKMSDSNIKKGESPPRPAVLELGMEQSAAPPPPKATEGETKPRVVHYTEFRTPLEKDTATPQSQTPSTTLGGKESPREMKEITATAPPAKLSLSENQRGLPPGAAKTWTEFDRTPKIELSPSPIPPAPPVVGKIELSAKVSPTELFGSKFPPSSQVPLAETFGGKPPEPPKPKTEAPAPPPMISQGEIETGPVRDREGQQRTPVSNEAGKPPMPKPRIEPPPIRKPEAPPIPPSTLMPPRPEPPRRT